MASRVFSSIAGETGHIKCHFGSSQLGRPPHTCASTASRHTAATPVGPTSAQTLHGVHDKGQPKNILLTIHRVF